MEIGTPPEAFDRIVRQYYGKILSYCGYFLRGNRQAAEDCTQDIFIILYNRLGTLNNYEKIGGWLYKTAANLVRQYAAALRKEQKRIKRLSDFSEEGDSPRPLPESLRWEDILDRLGDEEREEKIRAGAEFILGRLKKEEREIWRIVFREKRPIRDVALELKLSPSAAKSRVARLRHKIRALVYRFFET
ncbi:MAG: sigma-70 family RNA polymerase sigma factor [Spirochaetales bacterium]|jgi:RNA polymerase sigma-70 factor (ECF subfamily)|nr:sigma-70 family RNA polymerase sigma factor [Spirochaetales bacterium]